MKNKQYLLDTNTLIEINAGTPSVIKHLLAVGAERCCMSVISLYELYYGAHYAKRIKKDYYEKEMRMIHKLLEQFQVLGLPENGGEYAELKNVLRESGSLIDEFDMLIAGQALTEGLTIVTDNTKHFNRIPGLATENWMER